MPVNEWKKIPSNLSIVGAYDVDFYLSISFKWLSSDFAFEPFKMGAMYGAFVQYSPLNLWRLVTPIFVHIGVEHFLFNMLALYFMGKMAEQIFGTPRFLGLYLLAGVMGNAFTLLFYA